MLVTRAPGGALRARPMVVVRIDDDGDVLLATSFGSEVHPIESEQQVALTFQFAMASVTVSGPARTVSDRAVIDAAWNGECAPGFQTAPMIPRFTSFECGPSRASTGTCAE